MTVRKISIARLSLTGGLSLLIVFVACWIGAAAFSLPVTHRFITLFTSDPIASITALCIGAFWAFIWGAFVGAVTALVFNLVGFVDRAAIRPAGAE